MARGDDINIPIAGDASKFLRETDDVADALDDVADALDDVARDSKDAADDGADSFRDLTKKVEDTKDKSDDLADSFDDVRKKAKKAGDDGGKDFSKGMKVGLDDVKDEAKSSGAEAAASFSGEMTDGIDFAQEVIANLGPAGIAGAAIIGAVVAVAADSVTQWEEKIAGITDATASAWQDAAAEGRAYLDEDALQAEAHRIIWDDAFKSDLEAAERAGISRSDFALALAQGEGEIFDQVHQQFMTAKDAEIAKQAERNRDAVSGGARVVDTYNSEESAIDVTVKLLDEKAKAVELNKKRSADAAAATKTLHEQEREQIQRTRDADQARYEAMVNTYGKPIQARVDVQVNDAAIREFQNRTYNVRVEGYTRTGVRVI